MATSIHHVEHGISLVTGAGELPAVAIDTAAAHALVYLQGAHLAEWTPAGFGPILWMSDASAYEPGVALRGGIPLCFPWFGTGVDGRSEPNHGWARIHTWDYLGGTVDADGTAHIELALDSATAATGTRYALRLSLQIGTSLTATLTATNVGSQTALIENALHAYWNVADVRSVTLTGLDNSPYTDRVAGSRANAAPFPAITGQEIDRIYPLPPEITVTDPIGGTRIHLTSPNAAQAVVWNPGAEKAASIADIGDDDWQRFVCVEVLNAREHTIGLAPGATHTLTLHADVEHH